MLTIGEINREVAHRCSLSELKIDCGSDGVSSAEIAIIAEAPGERERINKIPLSGAGGKYLWDNLRPIGINRRGVYISNAVKRQLGVDKNRKAEKISDGEREHYAAIVRWELQQLPNLRFVICLGNMALEAVTGLTGISNHRGSLYHTEFVSLPNDTRRDVQVFAMFNPAYVLRVPKEEVVFKFDIARFKRILNGTYKEYEIDSIINPSPHEAIRWIEKMQDEAEQTALDIETTGNETACIGLANDPHKGMCINFRDGKQNRFSIPEEIAIRLRLQRWFDERGNTRARLITQNGMFDASWLGFKDRFLLPPIEFDTMLAHHTLYPALPHNLGFLTSMYTEHPFYKDEGKAWKEGGDVDTHWRYNVKDCCITKAVSIAELQELKEQNLLDFFITHIMRLQPHLVEMTVGGIQIDVLLKEKIAHDTRIDVAGLRSEFVNLARLATGDDELTINPNSATQLAKLYFQKLHLTGRGVATDIKNRRRMIEHPRTPEIARRMLTVQNKYATEHKFLSTYAEMEIDKDGRVRCEYKQTGVVSAPGRLSSAATLWGSGTNLQNQPERSYEMFVADRGYKFTYFDLSQAEARVVAWKAPIAHWMLDFERARRDGQYDCHRSLASVMFNMPYDSVPMDDTASDPANAYIDGVHTIRYYAKRCRHGLNYRMGAATLAETLDISFNEAERLWHIYHKTNPELQEWWQNVVDEVKKTRRLYNAYGRRWILLERYDDNALESIVAFYPQSTIGDKVSRCIYLCETDPDWPTGQARIALNIHDALVALHKDSPDVNEAVIAVMRRHAEEPLIIKGYDGVERELIIPADLKVSVEDEGGRHRWSTLKKVKAVGNSSTTDMVGMDQHGLR